MKEGAQLDDSFSQLAGKRIGVQRGATADRFASAVLAKAGAEVVRYTSQDEIYLDLVARPPRRHLRRLHPAADRLPRYPARQGLRLRRAGVQGPEILRRGRRDRGAQGDAELVGKLNAAIDAIRADGTYKRIEGKYFKSDIYGD